MISREAQTKQEEATFLLLFMSQQHPVEKACTPLENTEHAQKSYYVYVFSSASENPFIYSPAWRPELFIFKCTNFLLRIKADFHVKVKRVNHHKKIV